MRFSIHKSGNSSGRRAGSAAAAVARLGRTLAVIGAAAVLLSPAAWADVLSDGDVLPDAASLPFDGGDVGGDIIVGGTSAAPAFPNFGRLVVDGPAFTDPLVSNNGYIGFNSLGIGEVAVAGFAGANTPHSEWRINDLLSIGVEGVGYLNVTNGGIVYSGYAGSSSGDEDMIVGQFTGSQGFVTVAGLGSQLVNTNLVVGLEGFGRIEATTRGTIHTFDEAIVGDESDIGNNDLGMGYVLLDGLGTRWNVGFGDAVSTPSTGTLTVGREGRGTVEIRNQALAVVNDDVLIGDENGSFGQVFISGQTSGITDVQPSGRAMLWTYENLFVGGTGTAVGELHVDNFGIARADGGTTVRARGLVELSGGTLLTPSVTNAGVIRGDGRIEAGTITNNGDIRNAAGDANHRERLWITGDVTNAGNIESVGGEIEFESAVTSDAGSNIVGKDAILRFNGGLTNNGNTLLDNTLVQTLGDFQSNAALTLAPNTSTLVGDLSLASSNSLFVELGSADHSRLLVGGLASLGGVLDISLTNGYVPKVGDSFEIMEHDGFSGMFSAVIEPPVPGIDFTVSYLANSVVINLIGGASGGLNADFDGNGRVDGNDFLIWQRNINLGTTQPQGDADGDGDVDPSDLAVWRSQFGGAPPSAPRVGAVPEPATLALLLAAGVWPVSLARSVRQRRSLN